MSVFLDKNLLVWLTKHGRCQSDDQRVHDDINSMMT